MKRLFVFKPEKKCLFKSPSPLTKKLHLATQFHPELNKEENGTLQALCWSLFYRHEWAGKAGCIWSVYRKPAHRNAYITVFKYCFWWTIRFDLIDQTFWLSKFLDYFFFYIFKLYPHFYRCPNYFNRISFMVLTYPGPELVEGPVRPGESAISSLYK